MQEQTTKQKILLAARQLFVEHGFAGTSMGKIAKLAAVNHSLLFHYFGSKDKLWMAVKQSIARDTKEQSKTLPSTDLPFAAFLEQLMTRSIRFYRDHPDIVRMINWQRLEHSHEPNMASWSEEGQAWIDAFKHYQAQGAINSELKPEFIVIYILSIVSSAALDPYIFIKEENEMKAYILFCIERIMQGIK